MKSDNAGYFNEGNWVAGSGLGERLALHALPFLTFWFSLRAFYFFKLPLGIPHHSLWPFDQQFHFWELIKQVYSHSKHDMAI